MNNICKDEHSSVVTDPESGEDICSTCGAVLLDRPIQKLPGQYVISQSDRKLAEERKRNPLLIGRHNAGLATIIGKENRDASGNHLNPALRLTFSNMRMWDHFLQYDSETRNLTHVSVQLRKYKEKLGLTYSIIERTAYFYRRVHEKRMIMGRTKEATLAACVYIACREAKIPRTLNNVAKAGNITYKEISSVFRQIVISFNLRMPAIDQMHCLVRLANATEVGEKVKRHSLALKKEIIEKELSAGKDPMGLAAAVLYLASQIYGDTSKSQRYFADAAGVTDVTVRNRCNELRTKISFVR